jgi:hypothetical protein
MNIIAVSLTALSLTAPWSLPVVTLPTASKSDAMNTYALRTVVAQSEVQIPSDAQLERMEERAITTNPLDDSEARALRGGEQSENLQMDRRAHRIDEQLLNDDGICAGCR